MHEEFTDNLMYFRAVFPENNKLEAGPLVLFSAMETNIKTRLNEELLKQDGLKYLQVLTVELKKLALTVGKCMRKTRSPAPLPQQPTFEALPITNPGKIRGLYETPLLKY